MGLNTIKKKIIHLLGFPEIYDLDDIFTPATAADINYVERSSIDSRLSSEMSIRGKQIIVFGDSGSGKTSSVRKLLKKNNYNVIKTHCENSTTFEQLILNAFDDLNPFMVSERVHNQSVSKKGEIATEYLKIKASIDTISTNEEKTIYTRVLPHQLTPQKLAHFMGERQIIWIIEDFHKVSPEEKVRIADVLKIFVDNANDYPQSKIICIGACQSAHELIDLDPNLQSRVSEISIPLLTNDEIKKIITNGFSLLNVVPSESLVKELVFYSARLGTSVHQMCMNICNSKNIKHTCRRKSYVTYDALKCALDGFLESSEKTFTSISKSQDKLGWHILKSFTGNNNNFLSFDEIVKRVNGENRHYDKERIMESLNNLLNLSYNIIHYNHDTGMYSLSSPIWYHFLIRENERSQKKKDKHNDVLTLNDSDYGKSDVANKSLDEFIERLEQDRQIDLEILDTITDDEY